MTEITKEQLNKLANPLTFVKGDDYSTGYFEGYRKAIKDVWRLVK